MNDTKSIESEQIKIFAWTSDGRNTGHWWDRYFHNLSAI